MRALRYVVLPDEDGVAFQALENALFEELAPVGALQLVLARRIAMAAWRLAPPTAWRSSCSRSAVGSRAASAWR